MLTFSPLTKHKTVTLLIFKNVLSISDNNYNSVSADFTMFAFYLSFNATWNATTYLFHSQTNQIMKDTNENQQVW